MTEEKEYFHYVQVLRGGAALLVIWSHLVGWWLPRYQPNSALMTYWGEFFVQPLKLYQNGGHLGVLIFFLISGFVTAHTAKKESRRIFLTKRFIRIVPTYLLALIITAIISYMCMKMNVDIPLGTNSTQLVDYVFSFFLLNYIVGTPAVLGVTWTLLIEVLFYIMMALLLPALKRDPVKTIVYYILIISGIIMLSPASIIFLRIANYVVYLFYVILGAIIYYGIKQLIPADKAILLGGTCFFLFILYYDYLNPGTLFSDQMPVIYTDVLAIILFLASIYIVHKPSRIMNFFGNISYPLYLIHLPVGCLIMNALQAHGVAYKYSLPCAILSCFTLSYFIYKYFEKPLQKKMKMLLRVEHTYLNG